MFTSWSGHDAFDTVRATFDHVELVLPPGTKADKTWPPVILFLASKANAPN